MVKALKPDLLLSISTTHPLIATAYKLMNAINRQRWRCLQSTPK